MKLLEPFLQWQDDIKAVRRDIHAHPELAYEELRTSDRVAELLTRWGIPIHRGLGGTGVVGILKGKTEGPAIGLRADMDALPMQETNMFAHAVNTLASCTAVAMMAIPPCCLMPRVTCPSIWILRERFI